MDPKEVDALANIDRLTAELRDLRALNRQNADVHARCEEHERTLRFAAEHEVQRLQEQLTASEERAGKAEELASQRLAWWNEESERRHGNIKYYVGLVDATKKSLTAAERERDEARIQVEAERGEKRRLQESLTACEQERDRCRMRSEQMISDRDAHLRAYNIARDRVRVLERSIERIDFANRQHEDVMRGANGFTRTIRDEVIAALTPAPPAASHTIDCNEGMTYGDSCSCAPPAETPALPPPHPTDCATAEDEQKRAEVFNEAVRMMNAPAETPTPCGHQWNSNGLRCNLSKGHDGEHALLCPPVARDASVDAPDWKAEALRAVKALTQCQEMERETRDGLCAEIDRLRAELAAEKKRADEAEASAAIGDKLLAERNRVLDALPCPTHGQCVPHALDEIDRLRAELAAANEEIARLNAEVARLRAEPDEWAKECEAHAATKAELGRAVAFLMKRNYSSPTNNHESFDWYRERDAILADADSKGAGKEWTVKARAIEAWCQWYSKRLNSGEPQHSGYEQDLFEAFGCVAAVDARRGSSR
jgi:hypothetical protein